MTDDRDSQGDAPNVRHDVQDEPLQMNEDGMPDPPDPQAGMLVEDDAGESDAGEPLQPRVGDPIGY